MLSCRGKKQGLRISPKGELAIYPVGICKACTSWVVSPEAKQGKAWVEPKKKSIAGYAELIEAPIKFDSRGNYLAANPSGQ